jgi:hypothetical protein
MSWQIKKKKQKKKKPTATKQKNVQTKRNKCQERKVLNKCFRSG